MTARHRWPVAMVEAFTERPFGGNGAGVVVLDAPVGDAVLQAVAASLNQSETAFLLRSQGVWWIRWFTPTCEVSLCGHATLAAVLALAHWQLLPQGQTVDLHSRSGILQAMAMAAAEPGRSVDGALQAWIILPSGHLDATPVAPHWQTLLGSAPQAQWSSPLGYTVVLLDTVNPIGTLTGVAEGLQGAARQGLVVMQALDSATPAPTVLGQQADYQLRFFAPGLGLPEDPVTGSAHALVAPYWIDRLQRRRVVGWQPSRRGGGMICEGVQDGQVRLTGTGHLLWDGQLDPGPGPSQALQSNDSEIGSRIAGGIVTETSHPKPTGWDALMDPARALNGEKAQP